MGLSGRTFVVGDGKLAKGARSGQELWVVEQQTGKVTLIDVMQGPHGSLPQDLTVYRGKVYFSAEGDLGRTGQRLGRELWCSDGTVKGTYLLKDIAAGVVSSNPEHFCEWRGRLYFAADNELDGTELWATDGSAKGTRMVRDINQGVAGSDPYGFAPMGDKMAFIATTLFSGTELFVTDGTIDGTRVIDTLDGPASGVPRWLHKPAHVIAGVDGLVFFASNGKLNRKNPTPIGFELWCSDGTRKGTRFIAELWPGAFDSFPSVMVRIGDTNKVAFVARVGTGAQQDYPGLFVTDGTAKGTKLLQRVHSGWSGFELSDAGRFGARQSYVLLPHYDVQRQRSLFELVLTDGTPSGTRAIVNDVMPAHGNAPAASALVANSGQLFITRVDARYGMEPFATTGHAISQPVGAGCGFGAEQPRLRSNDPRIGMPVYADVTGPPRSMGLLMVGMWYSAGHRLTPSCSVQVDLLGPQVFRFFATDAIGRWRGGLRSNGATIGAHYAIQAAVADARRTGTTMFTNPVVLRAGNR